MVDRCELCQKNMSVNEYVVHFYRGSDIYLCKECDSKYQVALSDTASKEEKERTQDYFQELLSEDKPTDVGGLFIQEKIQGETIDPQELTQAVKKKINVTETSTEIKSQSSFGGFLRILAWIVWIGGLIISILGARVTVVSSYYSDYTQFSFVTFLTLFATYLINGALLFGLATVVDKISETHEMTQEIMRKLYQLKNDNKQ